MTFDSSVPDPLKRTQQWFASIITRPIDEESRMIPISPSGIPMAQEAWNYISPSPTLQPAQRIEIYNQQYWWRLLSNMHETYPLLTRLFGYFDFNQSISFPYLVKYPPNHWSLNLLGDRLFKWVEEEYFEKDKQLVLDAVRIDWAFNHSFVVPSKPALDLSILSTPEDMSSLLDQPVSLQPHVQLFELPYDLFRFRIEFLKQNPDYWLDNDFPPLPCRDEMYYFVLFRDRANNIDVVQIEKSEYQVLKRFQAITSVEAVCEWLEEQDEAFGAEAATNLPLWFQHWTMRQWLSINSH